MGDFKPINTQEELDEVIKDRLIRQKDSILKDYSDYDSLKKENEDLKRELADVRGTLETLSTEKEDFEKTIEELTGKVKTSELTSLKVKYAIENGIPHNLALRISGDDEASIKEDAESLANFFKSQIPTPPLKNTENIIVDNEEMAYKNLVKELKGD